MSRWRFRSCSAWRTRWPDGGSPARTCPRKRWWTGTPRCAGPLSPRSSTIRPDPEARPDPTAEPVRTHGDLMTEDLQRGTRSHRRRRATTATAAALTLLLLAGACSSDEDEGAAPDASTSTTAADAVTSCPAEVDEADFMAADEMRDLRSEEHTSELQSLMRISYAVFCLKKKKHTTNKES